MPRSPTTPMNYSLPSGTTAVSGQVISSVAYNNFLSDLVNNALNSAWPVPYGGNGTTDGSTLVPDGSAATPAMRFQNETNTGFYRVAAGQLGVSIQGVNVGTFTSTGLSITNPISITGSSAGFTPFTGISTASGAAAGPIIELYRNNTAAANNVDGRLLFTGQNSTLAKVTYAFEQQVIVSPTAGAEYGAVDHYVKVNGTDTRTFSTGPNNPNTPFGFVDGYATTATAAGTTTLTVTSAKHQYFTGTTTQTVTLPVATTLVNGQEFWIHNNSTGRVTVNTSGGTTLQVMGGTFITFAPGAPGTILICRCINTGGGTGSASWDFEYISPTTGFVSYTPTFTNWGTVTNISIWSRRVGDIVQIRGVFTAGTVTASEARMTLGYNGTSGNISSDATKVPSIQMAGNCTRSSAGNIAAYTLIESSIGYLTFGAQYASGGGITKAPSNVVATTGDTLTITADVPVANG